MATARKFQKKDGQDSAAVKSHPLYIYVRRVHENIANHTFRGLEASLHEIASRCKEENFRVSPHSVMNSAIIQLFAQAKLAFNDSDEYVAGIRCKQAMYLENMGQIKNALDIYTSVANMKCTRRWHAMNCRTWLLKASGKFEAAKESAEELLTAYEQLPIDQKPSNNAFTSARKMLAEIMAEDVSEKAESATATVSTSHFTKFSRGPRPDKQAPLPTAEVYKEGTAFSLSQ